VDSGANVYVADPSNGRIQKFTNEGAFIRMWGTSGIGEGQFLGATNLAVDSSNNVYVADSGNNRIQKFTNEGRFIRAWGGSGTGEGQFLTPVGIAVDLSANVFVADNTSRAQKFTNEGAFITMFPGGSITGIAIKSANVSFLEERVFLGDRGNNCIKVFRPELISDT
jgi:DNA-binding beta-propeller fold protein YncE